MTHEETCPGCGRPAATGARFCTDCGRGLRPSVSCPTCALVQDSSNLWCMDCGAEMPDPHASAPAADGAVQDGVWQRGPDELVRRVDPQDARTFLGNRVVRVPPGTVGLVMVDGVVERVLPPGQQTTRTFFERVTDFFTGGDGRSAFYLVDLRPVPVPFVVRTRPAADGVEVRTQVLVTFSLHQGDKLAMARFIATALGHRPACAAAELHDLLRPEVTRVATQVLERMAAEGALRYEEAEARIQARLVELLGPRYGLSMQVTVSTLTAVTSLDFHLGTAEAPAVRPCGDCGAELPASMRFCDGCGSRQPAHAAAAGAAADSAPLFTSDGAQVELDLVVRVQGQHEDFAPERVGAALSAAAAAWLRERPLTDAASAAGFTAVEAALAAPVGQTLATLGLKLVAVTVVDLRSKTGQWLLGARADLTRARQDANLAREWLAQRGEQADLAQLAFAQRLRQQRVEREARLGEAALALRLRREQEDLEAREQLARAQGALQARKDGQVIAEGGAALDADEARRAAARDIAVQAAARQVDRTAREADHQDLVAEQAHDQTLERGAFDHDVALQRDKAVLESERLQRAADDAAYAGRSRQDVAFEDHQRRAQMEQALRDREEARQIEKLRAMVELDKDLAAQEHAHDLQMRETLKGLSEREMIAAQAAQLAAVSPDGGAAWAKALAGDEARAAADAHSAALQRVMREQMDRMERMADSAMSAAGVQQRETAGAQVYAASMDAMSRVAASRAAPTPSVTAVAADGPPCTSCGGPLRADARFCGHCGQGR